MATAEKEVAETTPPSPYAPLRAASLLGAVFVLTSLWIVLAGLPLFWTEVVRLHEVNAFLSGALLILAEAAAIAVVIFLGRRFEGAQPAHGARAGIFFLCCWALLTLWIANKVAWMFDPQAATLSATVTAVVVGLMLFLAFWMFRKPGFCQWLIRMEDRGWFHATSYKPTQGLRVRRCTVVALLVLGVCGIFVLAKSLGSDRPGPNNEVISNDWKMHIPFLGKPGVYFGAYYKDNKEGKGAVVTTVESESPAERAGLQDGDVIIRVDDKELKTKPADELQEHLIGKKAQEGMKLVCQRGKAKQDVQLNVLLASGHPAVPLMYKVHVTLPLILALLLVWVSWRIVNLPGFGDFLIATEAEMNKVSWTSGKRLRQDTVVVLVTVILLSLFLFFIDILWIKILSNEWIGVLKVDLGKELRRQQEKTQW